ncbi:hypothetical protein K439DRAFT_1612996 [Ramaria rubella]|nr:hypothetical protein K439DRAFT_1612996 [Ramaria rubella]
MVATKFGSHWANCAVAVLAASQRCHCLPVLYAIHMDGIEHRRWWCCNHTRSLDFRGGCVTAVVTAPTTLVVGASTVDCSMAPSLGPHWCCPNNGGGCHVRRCTATAIGAASTNGGGCGCGWRTVASAGCGSRQLAS